MKSAGHHSCPGRESVIGLQTCCPFARNGPPRCNATRVLSSERNGAEKISEARFDASVFLKNFGSPNHPQIPVMAAGFHHGLPRISSKTPTLEKVETHIRHHHRQQHFEPNAPGDLSGKDRVTVIDGNQDKTHDQCVFERAFDHRRLGRQLKPFFHAPYAKASFPWTQRRLDCVGRRAKAVRGKGGEGPSQSKTWRKFEAARLPVLPLESRRQVNIDDRLPKTKKRKVNSPRAQCSGGL